MWLLLTLHLKGKWESIQKRAIGILCKSLPWNYWRNKFPWGSKLSTLQVFEGLPEIKETVWTVRITSTVTDYEIPRKIPRSESDQVLGCISVLGRPMIRIESFPPDVTSFSSFKVFCVRTWLCIIQPLKMWSCNWTSLSLRRSDTSTYLMECTCWLKDILCVTGLMQS